jgi:nucleoside-diphosphate kinase
MANKLHPAIHKVRFERTFCMIKPDGVYRSLIGEIVGRFERAGLKVVAMKMVVPTRALAEKHYPTSDEKWVTNIGNNTYISFENMEGITIKEVMGTEDKYEIGKLVSNGLVDFLCSGPVVAMVIEGVQAIQMVRKLIGSTLPFMAPVGTVRGDYSIDNPIIANAQIRPIHNLLHASGNAGEAEHEIALWFGKDEVYDYKLGNEEISYDRYY